MGGVLGVINSLLLRKALYFAQHPYKFLEITVICYGTQNSVSRINSVPMNFHVHHFNNDQDKVPTIRLRPYIIIIFIVLI